MRLALLLGLALLAASCGNQARLVDGRLQAYRYVIVERADEVGADGAAFAGELAAELARSGFEVVDAGRLAGDRAAADEAVQAYARLDPGGLWTSVAVVLKDYRSGAEVWEHADKSNTRAKALEQCLERLRRQHGGFSAREAELKRQRADAAPVTAR